MTTVTAWAMPATRTTAWWWTPANPNACLDPNAAFAVSAGGSISLNRGEALRLPLFANRNNVGIQYTWTVSKRPNGSSAAVQNPEGVVSVSRHWSYAYPDTSASRSSPLTCDGEYTLQLTADHGHSRCPLPRCPDCQRGPRR